MYKVGSVVYEKNASLKYTLFLLFVLSLSFFLSIVKYGHRYQQGPRLAVP